jgi:hypothetical protein
VFVDGKYLGPAANFRVARTYPVAAGEHDLKLVDPRYEELTTKVTITAGKKTTVHETRRSFRLLSRRSAGCARIVRTNSLLSM